MDQMDAFSTFILVIHVIAAILGFGVIAAFPLLGLAARQSRAHAAILGPMIVLIKRRIIYPAAGIQLITGLILIWTLHISLTQNAWLGASIVLFLIVLGVATGAVAPLERRLTAIVQSGTGSELSADATALMDKVRNYNVFVLAGLLVIIVLMVWQPGANL